MNNEQIPVMTGEGYTLEVIKGENGYTYKLRKEGEIVLIGEEGYPTYELLIEELSTIHKGLRAIFG
ncbi:MAG: hypothetical protein AB7V16_11880 [Vulcanibacillus sp.]